ncbi:lysylphosphatidylglycerol synthase domain-containing protein [Rhodanobacter sp. C01]|uniref:lysylphosphatidylglycerol synthase domain-containing protein n=1 Tax=Rhodanobacter sp. C01 TaxID=1945856 RepID=UPI0009CAB002|nr:lysylphosphatidylglycerol synthase domain-containing protein [Rhodanobacter sp. C01]OOG51070.1 hypothetical protein B0E50_02535 [Rhodanobacter sp. C01]
MSKIAKAAVRIVGGLLALAGIGWIVAEFVRTGVLTQLFDSSHFDRLAWFIVMAVPVYVAGLCCAGLAWCCLQTTLLPVRPAFRGLFATYATTQFAKYLPGNIGHYVGRHLLLRKLGMNHRALLLATFGEAGFLVLASLVWAASAMGVLLPSLNITLSAWQVLLAECVCLGASFAGLQWWRRRSERAQAWFPLHSPRWLLPVLPLQLLLFAAMALALMIPACVLIPNGKDIWLLPAAAAASWVVGFLVIGAPAGIGVREMVFLALLRGHMPESDILLLAAAFRIVTFSGDGVLLLLGFWLGPAPATRVRIP